MVVVFLGAGASAPFKYPVMAELTTELRNTIQDEEGRLLYHLSGPSRPYSDAETVLQDIEAFDTIYTRGLERTINSVTVYGQKGAIQKEFQEFHVLCGSLRETIRASIFDTYSFDPECASKFPLYDQLFSFLRSQKEICIYTTNYDRIIEEFCMRGKSYEIRDGFTHNVPRQRYLWNPENSFDTDLPSDKTTIKLFKLHGSLDWKKGPYGIERVTPQVRLGPRMPDLLTYPGSKDPPEEEPFRTTYERFEIQMAKPEPCLVIGFSFRDYYLNRFFRDFINRRNGQLLVMSNNCKETMSKYLFRSNIDELNPYFEKNRVVPIPCHFDEGDWAIYLSEALRKTGWNPPPNR